MPSSDAKALSEWVTAVARELGLEEPSTAWVSWTSSST